MIRPGTGSNYDYMLRAQVDKTESTREQTGNVSGEVEILTEPRRIKTLLQKWRMSFAVLTGRPDVAEERISEPADTAVKPQKHPPPQTWRAQRRWKKEQSTIKKKRTEYPRTVRKPECNTPIMGEPGGRERNRRNIWNNSDWVFPQINSRS